MTVARQRRERGAARDQHRRDRAPLRPAGPQPPPDEQRDRWSGAAPTPTRRWRPEQAQRLLVVRGRPEAGCPGSPGSAAPPCCRTASPAAGGPAAERTRCHQPAVEPARQPPGRERQEQVDQADRATSYWTADAERVHPWWRGLDQLRGEPRERGEHHDRPEAVLRPGSPGGKPAAQQRGAHDQGEHRRRARSGGRAAGARPARPRRPPPPAPRRPPPRQLRLHCGGLWRRSVTVTRARTAAVRRVTRPRSRPARRAWRRGAPASWRRPGRAEQPGPGTRSGWRAGSAISVMPCCLERRRERDAERGPDDDADDGAEQGDDHRLRSGSSPGPAGASSRPRAAGRARGCARTPTASAC